MPTIEAVFAHAIESWRRNDGLRGAHTVDQVICLSYGCGVQAYYRLAYSQSTDREAGTCQEPMGMPQTRGEVVERHTYTLALGTLVLRVWAGIGVL